MDIQQHLDGYELVLEMHLVIEREGREFVASHPDVLAFGFGDTEQDAKRSFCNQLMDRYEACVRNANCLSSLMARDFAGMQKYIRPKHVN